MLLNISAYMRQSPDADTGDGSSTPGLHTLNELQNDDKNNFNNLFFRSALNNVIQQT
jgi:hypothetical protein